MLTKRQVLLKYGFNAKTFDSLVQEGALCPCHMKSGERPTIYFRDGDIQSLGEGTHYVVCLECGAWQNQITSKHLKACCGKTLGEYLKEHPGSLILSSFTAEHKAKTEGQKERQSKVLKERFRTPGGEITRKQISEASKRMQASDYGVRAAEHLRGLTRSPEGRHRISQQMQVLYATGWNPARKWHKENPGLSSLGALNARRFLTHTRTKPHMKLKQAMVSAGISGFQTELEVGFYSLDEAYPELRVCVEVQGCYWHSCPVCGIQGPKVNLRRDKSKKTYLENRGWLVVFVWEHEIREDLDACVRRVQAAVVSRAEVNHVVC